MDPFCFILLPQELLNPINKYNLNFEGRNVSVKCWIFTIKFKGLNDHVGTPCNKSRRKKTNDFNRKFTPLLNTFNITETVQTNTQTLSWLVMVSS